VGIKLKITPHITKKKRITLDLYQEANTIIGETQTLTSGAVVPPTLGKRDIKTKVTVYDGMTIVIGGLIENRKNVNETKIPVLGDIPLLGWLFKNKSVSYSKSNLLVFITPHIMTKREKLESISKQKIETQKGLRK
jgi:general secretion pathway protein D